MRWIHREHGARGKHGAAAVVIVTALLAGLAGCGGSGSDGTAPAADAVHAAGIHLDDPYRLPDVTLTDTAGKPYPVAARAHGHVTLLFFGYTHCPDICPTTLADLARVRRDLKPALRHRMRVVFVTADPRRDTPRVIRAFLDHFDHSFIGLTGKYRVIKKLAAASHATVDAPAHPKPGTNYAVMHSAEVYVYSPDGRARLLFTGNTAPDTMVKALRPVLRSADA